MSFLSAKAAFQAKERQRLQQQHGHQQLNEHNKRPLEVLPATNRSPTNPNKRHAPRPATTGASALLQSTLGSSGDGSTSNSHFKGGAGSSSSEPPAKLKSMIGNYVEYDLATLKNSRGGFLLEGDDAGDPRQKRERQLQEEMKLKRLENARAQGQLRGSGNTPPFSLNRFRDEQSLEKKS